MSEPILNIHGTKEALARKLANDIQGDISRVLSIEDTYFLAISGGSTPLLLFQQLAKSESGIDWRKVKIFWVDERCVPPDDPESNFGATRRVLIEPLGLNSSSYFRIRGEQNPEEEAARYAGLILDVVSPQLTFPVFHRILLGMGDDGHTASIFPEHIEQWNEEKLCTVGIHPSGQKRVSFTGHLILAARKVTFVVTGSSKAEVVRDILEKRDNFERYPAALVKPHSGDLEWYLDKPAAAMI